MALANAPASVRDLVGTQFNHFTVMAYRGPHPRWKESLWLCKCSCGSEKLLSSGQIRKKRMRSCGCQRPARHGMTDTPTYSSWESMIARCLNPENSEYSNYGARGITVCERWRSFPNFLADMGKRPGDLSIERENNAGNYQPGNCRWATAKEQAQNRRDTVFITYKGVTRTRTQWSESLGIPYARIRSRQRAGMAVEQVLATQRHPNVNSRFTSEQVRQIRIRARRESIKSVAANFGVTPAAIRAIRDRLVYRDLA